MLAPNTILQNRYRIVRQLGQGGMGTVYEAVDQRLSSVVAIKETLITTPEARAAFVHEASLLANLRHRSLPNVIDHFAEGGGQYLVMEFIPGEDLAQLLELRGRPFPLADVLPWADEILRALEYLHSHRPPILHRDIKPSNLKLTREGELFLLDFGLAKGAAGQMPTLLTSRSVKGYTPVYSSLEQIHGGGTDPRSDLYSVGATLYHLLTGIPPVDAPGRFLSLDDEGPDPLRAADDANGDVSSKVAAVVSSAMAMNRRERPATAAEFRRRLLQAASLPLEPAITLPWQPAPELKPTEAGHGPDEAAPPRPAPPLKSEPPPKAPAHAEPTIDEIPNLIKRPARIQTTPVSLANQGAEQKPSRRKPVIIALLLLIPALLGISVIAVMLVIPWLNRPAATQSQTNGSPTPVTPAPVIKPDTPPGKRFAGEFAVGKALELVYGSYDYQKKYTRRQLTAEDLKGSDRPIDFNLGTVYTGPNLIKSFVQGGVQRYFLTTETVPARYDCHACAPLIGAATFSRQGDGWQLDAETKAISTMGSWGTGPGGDLIKIGPDKYGVKFNIGSSGQGETGEAVVIIAENGQSLREILVIDEYSGDNGGACGEGLPACWKYSSRMDFEPGANPEYHDVKVTTSGTRPDGNGNIRRANSVKKYTSVDGKYVPVK